MKHNTKSILRYMMVLYITEISCNITFTKYFITETEGDITETEGDITDMESLET